MKKFAIILTTAALVFLLASCSETISDVTYEKCNGRTGSVTNVSSISYFWRDRELWLNHKVIQNVCDYEEKEIFKNVPNQ